MKELLHYVSLSILGQLGISCYILADTFFVSKGLGTNGMTALNLAIPVYNFVFGTGLMLGVGGATRFSILKGMKHEKEAGEVYSHTLILTIFLSLFFVLLGIFGAGSLANLLGADQVTMEMTTTYLRWILIFAPAFMLNAALQCFVRNDGAPKLVMAAMLAGSFANILLDYIFIFPMKLGIFGAVIATSFSPVISMLILGLHWKKGDHSLHFVRMSLKGERTMQIFSLGFPSLLAQVSGGIVMILFNSLILGLEGNVGVAAYGVIANIAIVVTALYTGLAQGLQPLLSTDYGAGDHEKLRTTIKWGQVIMLLLTLIVSAALWCFAPQITSVFNSEGNASLQSIAEQGLRLYFISNLFVGFNTVAATIFTSVEKAAPAQVLSLLRGILLIVPLAFLMSAVWGMEGIWLSFPAAEGLSALIGLVIYVMIFTKEFV